LPVLYGLNAVTGATVVARNYEAQWGSNERPAIDGNQLIAEDGYFGGMSSFSTPSLGKQWTRPGHQLEKPFAAFDDQYVYAYGEEVFNRNNGASLPSLTHPWQFASLTDPMVSASSRVLLDVSGSEGGVTRNGVAAYDGDTHQLLWTANTPTYVGAKAVGNGIVAAIAGQQLLLFNEADGALLRAWNAPSSLLSEIVLTKSHVFVQSIASGVARVHAIDLATGREVWTFENRNSPSGTYAMEMAMAGGKLLLSNHDFVRAFGLGTANDAPIASNASLATNEEVQVSGNLSATDANGDAVTYAIVSGPVGGTFTSFDAATGNFTYRPTQNFNGGDGFTFKAIDSRGAVSSVANVSISVAPVNDAPFARAQVFDTSEDNAVEDFVFASDVDDDDLTYAIASNPTQGTLISFDHNNGLFRYVPKPNFFGTDSFTFRANDGFADSNAGTITIRVFAVNDAPAAQLVLLETSAGTAVRGQLAATDPDNAALTYSMVMAPTGGVISDFDPATGAFLYTPNAGFAGVDSLTYNASDGQLTSNTATARVQVNYVNQPPTAIDQTLEAVEDTSVTGRLRAMDDLGGVTFAIVSDPLRGTITSFNAQTGDFTYVPKLNHYGPDPFTFSVSDGEFTAEATMTINVQPVNDAPLAAAVWLYSTTEDTSLSAKLLASDVDNDPLTYTILSPPADGTLDLDASTGLFTYTPAANASGRVSLTYQVSDGLLSSNVGTLYIDISPVNDAPVAALWQFATPEDTALNDVLRASDVDGDALTYRVVTQPARGALTVTPETGAFTYTPAPDDTGTVSFTFEVTDGTAVSNTATVFITINPVNDAPVSQPLTLSGDEDSAISSRLSASDSDSATLTYALVAAPAQGQVIYSATTGQFTYLPDANYNGADSFTYRASDGAALSNVATVSIHLAAVNDAPVAANASLATNEDQASSGQVAASDVDSASLTYSLVSGPTRGALVLNADGTYTYTPQANYFGADSFVFRASDGSAPSNEATVSINIAPVNDAPMATADSASGNEDANIVIAVLANDRDVDGDALVPQVVSGPTHGTVTVNPSGTITYDPATDYVGTDSFTYRVSDGSLASNVVTVSISLAAQTETPQISVTPDDPAANVINLASSEVAVAILSTDSFNASQVVISSLTFGRLGTEKSLVTKKKAGPKYELRDVNGDGRVDLVAYFKPSSTGLTTSSTQATLRGRLADGQLFSATSPITVINSKGGKPNRGNSPHSASQTTAAFDAYFEELEKGRNKDTKRH
jgi:VCBS repeat-containing protein